MPSGKEKKQLVEGLMAPAADNYTGFLAGGIPQNPSAVTDYLTPYASGEYVDGGSPAFLAAQDYQAGRMTDDVNRTFSGLGRYGSGAHTGVLADSIGNFRNQGLANEIARQQGQQMQAAGAMSAEQALNQQTALGATYNVPGFLANDPRQGNQFGGALGGAISGLTSPFPIAGAILGGLGGWMGGY